MGRQLTRPGWRQFLCFEKAGLASAGGALPRGTQDAQQCAWVERSGATPSIGPPDPRGYLIYQLDTLRWLLAFASDLGVWMHRSWPQELRASSSACTRDAGGTAVEEEASWRITKAKARLRYEERSHAFCTVTTVQQESWSVNAEFRRLRDRLLRSYQDGDDVLSEGDACSR